MKLLIVLGLLLSGTGPAGALGPMYRYHDLVAGKETAGMENGFFHSALFHTPLGITVDPASNQLFVADSDNHCLRVIDLSEENKVSTLAGTGKAGGADGFFSLATLLQAVSDGSGGNLSVAFMIAYELIRQKNRVFRGFRERV